MVQVKLENAQTSNVSPNLGTEGLELALMPLCVLIGPNLWCVVPLNTIVLYPETVTPKKKVNRIEHVYGLKRQVICGRQALACQILEQLGLWYFYTGAKKERH